MATANPLLASIDEGVALADPHVTVYFATDGERIDFATEEGGWSRYARAQAMAALDAWAAVSGLSFAQVSDPAEADFKLVKSDAGGASLGFMTGPDPAYGEAQGLGWFNSGPYWSGGRGGLLSPGSYMFTIFLHEFGHGLGLAHPHEATGGSTAMPQVGEGLGLDQGVWTVMTYNDGWPEAPEGLPESHKWGWNLGPSALDIAVIQAKYGVNPETGAGDDRYRLPAANEAGTGYRAIWDAGGEDLIFHRGRRDAVIDLRPATLELEDGGAGRVSRAEGVHGGFTLAHGVTVEAASGARGDDRLIGNAADNVLKGKAGADRLFGGGGEDRLLGGGGNDRLFGGEGDDRLIAGPGRDRLTGGEGADVFVLRPGDGRAAVADLGPDDRLDLRGFGYAGVAEVQADLKARDAGAVLKAEGLRLVLLDLDPDDLAPDMVLI
ncbi:M10 family metallopeptidase [Albimonas pacifica]|uniref:Serralysin n=1 Tax=Albimonas pacifica TaxID=1114924 RepID=A0A1I3MDV0_9RHOB|nr:M10 family metallopeptidase [Albimonas pacifica]SFI95112.1 serralysin [Albimonas pacifica]